MNKSPEPLKRSFKSRVYFLSYKIRFWFFSRKQNARWTGFWLGMLGHRDFHGLDDVYYEEKDKYRTDEHNGRGLFHWEESCLNRYFPASGSLLLIGAGGGREVLALSKRGYDVHGYECNLHLVEFANDFLKRQGVKSTVSFIARDCAPVAEKCYDGVVVGWGAYMLIPERQNRINFLHALSPHLKEGGPIFLSFFARTQDAPYFCTVRDIANRLRRLRRQKMIEIGDDLTPLFVHQFTREEIEGELADAGFSLTFFQGQGTSTVDSAHAVAIKN